MYRIAIFALLVLCQEAHLLPTWLPDADAGETLETPWEVPEEMTSLGNFPEYDDPLHINEKPNVALFVPLEHHDEVKSIVEEAEMAKDQAPFHNDRDHIIFLHGLSKGYLPHNENYEEHDRLLDQAIHALGEKNIFADEVAHMHVHRSSQPMIKPVPKPMEQDDDHHHHKKQPTLQKFMEREHMGPRIGAHRWAYQNLRGGKPAIDDRPHPLNFTFNSTIEDYAVWDKRKRVLTFILFLLSPIAVFYVLSLFSNMSLWDFLKDLWEKFKDMAGLVCEEYVCEEEIIEEEEIIIKEPTPIPTPSPDVVTPIIPEPPPKKPLGTIKPKPPPPPPPPPKRPPPPLPPSTPSSYDEPPLDKCCPCIPSDSQESFDDTIAYPCGEMPCEFAKEVRYFEEL